MLSVASGHFASQWKTERMCFHGSDARILLQGLISSYSEQCLCDNSALCGKEVGRVGVTQEFSICKDTFFVANFVRGVSLHFTSTNSHSQISHCADAFIWLGKKKPYLKCHWKCSERFGVWAQRKPCTCMFTALSLATVRPPLLDKCKAFSALSTSYWPVLVQWLFFLYLFLRIERSAFMGGWYNTSVTFWPGNVV